MSWYRKYRPQMFADLVGQDYVRKILLNALKKGQPAHAYLLSGPRGTGKTSIARILGKALNCLSLTPEGEPCNVCVNCRDINEQRFVDLLEIDAASNTGVDHIRDLREKIGFMPTSGKAKVYIIDEVHMLSGGAFNALLKTLEEPPAFVYFILATTEIHKVPETVQSRCQRFTLRKITPADILQRLLFIVDSEHVKAEKEALDIIAAQAGGGLRDAIALLEQYTTEEELTAKMLREQMGLVPDTTIATFYAALEQGDSNTAFDLIDELVREGFALSEFARAFLLFLREKLLQAQRENISVAEPVRYIEIFEEAQRKMKFAVIPQLPLELAVVKFLSGAPNADGKKVEPRKILGIFSAEKKPETVVPPPEEKEKESEEPQIPDPGATFLAPELDTESVRQHWPQILESLKNSLLRMALRNAEIADLADGILTLQFPAITWKEQVEKTENAAEFLNAFENVFSRRVELQCLLKSVQLEPAIQETVEENDSSEVNPVAMLEEIMGSTARKNGNEGEGAK